MATDFGYFPAPPSGTLPPRSVNGVRVGHERTLVEAQQLLATVAAIAGAAAPCRPRGEILDVRSWTPTVPMRPGGSAVSAAPSS